MTSFIAQPQRIPAAYYRTAAYPPPAARADVRDDYERTYGCLSLLLVLALTRTHNIQVGTQKRFQIIGWPSPFVLG